MAMALDLTTVFRTKCAAVLSGSTANDVTTKMSTYVQSVVATGASSARKDVNTRVWLDLPHT
jgi:hypothetical protein